MTPMNPLSIECRCAFHPARPRPQGIGVRARSRRYSTPSRVPRIARLLALAHRLERLGAYGRGPGLTRRRGPAGSRYAGRADQPNHDPVVPGPGHPGDDPVPAPRRPRLRPSRPARVTADRRRGGLGQATAAMAAAGGGVGLGRRRATRHGRPASREGWAERRKNHPPLCLERRRRFAHVGPRRAGAAGDGPRPPNDARPRRAGPRGGGGGAIPTQSDVRPRSARAALPPAYAPPPGEARRPAVRAPGPSPQAAPSPPAATPHRCAAVPRPSPPGRSVPCIRPSTPAERRRPSHSCRASASASCTPTSSSEGARRLRRTQQTQQRDSARLSNVGQGIDCRASTPVRYFSRCAVGCARAFLLGLCASNRTSTSGS